MAFYVSSVWHSRFRVTFPSSALFSFHPVLETFGHHSVLDYLYRKENSLCQDMKIQMYIFMTLHAQSILAWTSFKGMRCLWLELLGIMGTTCLHHLTVKVWWLCGSVQKLAARISDFIIIQSAPIPALKQSWLRFVIWRPIDIFCDLHAGRSVGAWSRLLQEANQYRTCITNYQQDLCLSSLFLHYKVGLAVFIRS